MADLVTFGGTTIMDNGIVIGRDMSGGEETITVSGEVKKATHKLLMDFMDTLKTTVLTPDEAFIRQLPILPGFKTYCDINMDTLVVGSKSFGDCICTSLRLNSSFATGFGTIEAQFKRNKVTPQTVDVVTFGGTTIMDTGVITSRDSAGGQETITVTGETKQSSISALKTFIDSLRGTYLKPDDIQIVNIPRTVGVRIYSDFDAKTLSVGGLSFGSCVCTGLRLNASYENGYGIIEATFIRSIV